MKKNMGTADRIIRAVIAAIIVVLYISGVLTGALGIALLAVAGLFVITSLAAYCPMYALLGLSTIPGDKRHRSII